jgi:hypothetical protein
MRTLLQLIFGSGKKEIERAELPYGFFNYRLPGGKLVRAYNPPRAVITQYDEEGRAARAPRRLPVRNLFSSTSHFHFVRAGGAP